ncbi:ExeM/NucH family extracellular endonuclease [Thiomicrorhabdus sp. 6S2-11]|uniref:ExeM/NucH family extracellular endonuclease n=1 Tax=Thiomicrorhabdus marina TaxID=2818442 RepID=A0ABS3Q6B5_9GAMM|nr:ExeM/NucH family extracellular endonuclease [Thiomicrorhabdus marina]MBO1927874.1 ExeM/NucH family extracellular endonuclease [Thiomicrorhabdus marina]
MDTQFKKRALLALCLAAIATPAAADLVISEYIEGSSNNKAIELYNTSSIDIDLNDYALEFYFNGNTSVGTTIDLQGVIPAQGTFVVADDGASAEILSLTDQISTSSFFNGDDAVVLKRNAVEVVDSIGQVGTDPGSEWGTGDTSTQNNTLYRIDVTPDTDTSDEFNPADQWQGAPQDTIDGLGEFTEADGDLFFSEYIEGSGNNKALEIYNSSNDVVDLSIYTVEAYHNGRALAEGPSYTIALSGALASGDVFVLANPSADQAILDQTDLVTGSISFNGDDTLILKKDSEIIDSIGQFGVDPGSEWVANGVGTQNETLLRVSAPDADANDVFDPSVQWRSEAQDYTANLGVYGSEAPVDPEPSLVRIHDVQGSGAVSPLAGQVVTVEAVITAVAPNMNGYFIQEELADQDADLLTSEGVFVYGDVTGLAVGDKVQVTAKVTEYYDLTELTNVTEVTVLASGEITLPVEVALPFASADFMERYEGMLVSFPQNLTVTENYTLGRYGEFWLSSGGRLMIPTNVVTPGADANTLQAQNDLNRILVDDLNTAQNPDPVIYPAPSLDASNTLRSGYQLEDLTGVVSYGFGDYRIQPTVEPSFTEANPRTTAPTSVGGSLKVASFNVLNYFNGDGLGAGFPTSRGADTAEEFERQQVKIVQAISAMDVDIIGLMEIENDGYSANSAIASLVEALNAEVGETRYAFINPGIAKIGTDEIAVGLIYNQQTVTPKGTAAILDSSVDARFIDDKNRPALAQSFTEIATNGGLTVAVNHLKSKGSSCDSLGDPDLGDGQGNCNLTRKAAAEALVDWLATDPTNSGDSDRLIIGDLNAYAMEDPITAIKSAGYSDLIFDLNGGGYSYVFDGQSGYLDHALASAPLQSQVTGVTEWHINTDEPISLDYNEEYKSENQKITYYASDAYRSSDHDPVIIGLNLTPSAQFISVTDMHVDREYQKRGIYEYRVQVTVNNDLAEAVSGASVTAQWQMRSGTSNAICVTDAEGTCTLSIQANAAQAPTALTVLDVQAENLTYQAQANAQSEVKIGRPTGLLNALQRILARLF